MLYQPVAATPMAFARSIAAAYQRYGESPAQVLKLAQITPSQLKQPTAHITARQMEQLSGAAMQELDDEGLAEASGFRNEKSFIRAFREREKLSPGAFRTSAHEN